MKFLFFLFFFLPQLLFAQKNKLAVFDNLMDKTWKAEGKWGDGSTFKQEITFAYRLDSNIVLVETKGFTNKEKTIFGHRNHGIRKYDSETETIQFWEFDIFGGTTQGTVTPQQQSLLYQYQYGDFFVSEHWEYVNDSTYTFTIGDFREGEWKQIFLLSEFKSFATNKN